MKLKHFHELKPHCLICRDPAGPTSPLVISHAIREAKDDILEGIVRCSNRECQFEYPIIDGIPFLLANLRGYIAANLNTLRSRTDFSSTLESVLGDCCGPASEFETQRQQMSSYGWCHYGDLDDQCSDTDAGSTAKLLESMLEMTGSEPSGGPAAVLDVGCSVGRTTFELARHHGALALGVDVNPGMLQTASRGLRSGVIDYPLKRVGLVYDERRIPVNFENHEDVDFWACDALDLPFLSNTFAGGLCLNTLDSVPSPVGLLQSLGRVLSEGAMVHFACPYDWSSAVTPVENWIGGHSQRAAHGGFSGKLLREWIEQEQFNGSGRFQVIAERDGCAWVVRLHDRSRMMYDVDALALKYQAGVGSEDSMENPPTGAG